MPNPIGLLRHPLVTVAAGAGAVAAEGASTVYRTATRLPFVGERLTRGVTALSRRGDAVINAGVDPLRALLTTIAVQIVGQVLAELDLTALVRDNVDVNAIAREVDIDAIIDRIDLIGLADVVIDGVDLPAIIRQSTTSVTAEVMTDVRSQGERADDLVTGIVDRMLGRTRDGL
ncbi:hypothetical protein [Mycolicibacterium komossense]|uniref:ABC transporter n=1 Tax=Mycolicibacterium komossense TaxID=1779 RepID=A0ABT3CBA1_9MYCO|nr:hypothetical protein [Mycolicibacterium komossense]MCV7226712.1 hypothetical protein [Mycolicibacterium komossense]